MKLNKIKYNFNKTDIAVYIRNDVDLSVFNEIFKYREYKSCEEILKNANNSVIDLGAHAGFFSIYSYCFNKKVKIYAIEPEKNNLEFLALNKKENSIDNIRIIEHAIASKSGDGELIVSQDSINHRLNLKLKNPDLKTEIQNIKTLSLKDFFEQNKIKIVSLLKVDIEGGEYDIFENIDHDILNKIENIILEYHINSGIDKNKYNEKFLENILRINGFSVQLFPSGFDKKMGFILARNKSIKKER